MGTFAGFAGEKNIPDNKKEEFEKALIKILNYGGMMSLEPVRMYNKEVGLISPVQLGEDGTVTFHYNYFEDDSWEDAGYCEKGLWSNKVGSAEFNDVMMTAYTLYEFYNEAYGYASLGNEPAPYLECYIGWINHLLKTEFSMMARRNIWELFETENIRRSRIEYSRSLSYDDAQHIVPDSLKWAAPVTELADMYLISEGYEDFIAFSEAFPEYKAEIKEAKQCLKEYFGEEGQEEKFTELLGLLSKSMSERQQETGPLKKVAACSSQLPARDIVFLASEILGKRFWEIWRDIKDRLYSDEHVFQIDTPQQLLEKNKAWEVPVKPIKTSSFLVQDSYFFNIKLSDELRKKLPPYQTNDNDRLYWWDETSEVCIAPEIHSWLFEIAQKHKKIMDSITSLESEKCDLLKEMMETFSEAEAVFKHIFPFKTMFYEFTEHQHDVRYIAAIRLIKELMKENAEYGELTKDMKYWDTYQRRLMFNPGRLIIKRYVAFLANSSLRERYLEF